MRLLETVSSTRARFGAFVVLFLCASLVAATSSHAESLPHAAPIAPTFVPFVIKPKVLDVRHAAAAIARIFHNVRTRADVESGSVIIFARPNDIALIRSTFDALDAKGATTKAVQAFSIRPGEGVRLRATLREMYPDLHVDLANDRTLVVSATADQLTEITALVNSIDATPAPAPVASRSTEDVEVTSARPADVARRVASVVPGVHAVPAGSSVVVSGAPDAVSEAKALVASLDVPPSGARFTRVYRLRAVDAESVAQLVQRTFPDVTVNVDAKLNAFTANATAAEHQRIADAVRQLDGATIVGAGGIPVEQPGHTGPAMVAPNGTVVEVVTLRAAAPGVANAPSTTAADIAGGVLSALRPVVNDLNITAPPNNPSQLIVTGSPESVRLAREVIGQLDVAQKLVILDTEILEVDETSAKNLGFSLGPNPQISTTYTETTPAPALNGLAPALLGLQQLTRTPISFMAQLNLLVSHGNARIIADPRITTISGRTATIRAGENIAILTTTGGSSGTVATTQLQTFQTGVTLDITPVINADNFITVSLHPVVNSLTGTTNGVPQISTRDTQTTVAMQADQTLVIGGLIQDDTTRNETKIPFFGDLPLVGKIFRDSQLTGERNELIITVTPHVVNPGEPSTAPPQASLGLPSPQALPTVPPGAPLPTIPPLQRRASRPRTSAETPSEATSPVTLPTPTAGPTPSPRPSAAASTAGAFLVTVTPSPSPAPSVFTFSSPVPGSPAPSLVQILAATFTPTTLRNNTNVTCTATTTKAVTKVTIGYGGFTTQLASTSPGNWQASYNFTTTGLPFGQATVPLALTAYGFDGTTTQVTIPVSVLP